MRDFEMVLVAPIITGIIFAFAFHIRNISIVRFYILKSSQILPLIIIIIIIIIISIIIIIIIMDPG
jgi:hypothetical protein